MPRVSQKQVAMNREAIKGKASVLFRERGFDGVGIPEITRAAGLTQGSFYGHFESKEALVSEASDAAFEVGFERWAQHRSHEASLAKARAEFIREYLTVPNRDNPGQAGPIAALVGDVARLPPDAPVRRVFAERIAQVLEALWQLQSRAGHDELAEQAALTELSAIVGAMLLSRATTGTDLSEKFLRAVSTSLTGDDFAVDQKS